MASIIVITQIAGAIALLLFGLAQVRDGVTDAFGFRLKVAIGLGTRTGLRAFMTGVLATLGLQSSTATALLTASFVERDLIRGRMAQIVLLGANLGTALTAWFVSVGLEAFAPALFLAGYVMGRRKHPVWSGIGRALVGIGIMLISLTLLESATAPLRDSAQLAAFLPVLDSSWLLAVVFAAVIAALCSSSIAAVLLVASFVLPAGLTVALVLGANFGGAVPPVMATATLGPAARRLTLGNLVIRGLGCLVVLPFADLAGQYLQQHPFGPGLAVEFHLVFNLGLALLIWPFAGLVSRIAARLIPNAANDTAADPKWLDEAMLETPLLALTGAAREVLSIGDSIERMLDLGRRAFCDGNATPFDQVSLLEQGVDRRQQSVKTYLSRLGAHANDAEKRRSLTILDYVINLEHVGDIIEKGIVPALRKKIGLGLRFSDAGYQELEAMFIMTQENLRLAQSVFMTRDPSLAQRLAELKVAVRNQERQSSQRHLARLRAGTTESQETSSLHLDLLRDLKRINAHVASVAHLILDEEGLLVESRLRAT